MSGSVFISERPLIDENAKFQSITGDVAIVASRIQGKAEKDQVMISKAVYKRVCGSEDILCRYHGLVELKGKAEPQAIYRLMWHDEEIILEEPTTVRVYHAPEPGAARKVPRVLHVEVAQERDVLRISVHEGARGEAITIRNYEDIDLSMDFIDARCQELVDTLNRFNQKGRITRDAVLKMREIGQILYDRLFSPAIKEKLESTEAEFLCLNLDESLVHIPWELLNDGRNFLCRRFAMGRMLKTRQSLIGNRTRDLARPLKMLVVADPTGDLNGAYTEGIRIRDFLEPYVDDISVALRSNNIFAGSIRGKMRNFDIVHFAGHADYQPENAEESGWRLSDGILKAKDILNIAGTSRHAGPHFFPIHASPPEEKSGRWRNPLKMRFSGWPMRFCWRVSNTTSARSGKSWMAPAVISRSNSTGMWRRALRSVKRSARPGRH